MAKLDALRKIIREEVRAVFQEELAGILKEAVIANRGQQTIVEAVKSKPTSIPGTLNRAAPAFIPPSFGAGNPLNNILAETAMSMNTNDLAAFGGQGIEREVQTVESVDQMFSSARKSSNLEAIEINAVPDFSGVMAKMGIQ
jgi:hypothetical protein